MEYLLGKEIAKTIKEEVSEKIKHLDRAPSYCVLVNGEDSSSVGYVKMQEKTCLSLGIKFQMRMIEGNEEAYLNEIRKINDDPSIDACLITRPLFKGADENKIIATLSQKKDVDAMNPLTLGELFTSKEGYLAPATAEAIIEIIKYFNIDVLGKKVLVVGRSVSVGKPVSMMLLQMDGTVTIAHSKTIDLEDHLKEADIVVVAVGKPHIIDGDKIKEGAICIDAGIHYLESGIVGDVKPSEKLKFITKVPGGVGTVTSACLMKNILKCYERNHLNGK